MRRLLLALALIPATAAAGAPLSGAELVALITGRTLTYAEDDGVHGVEECQPGRQKPWAFAEDDCREGHWYPAGEAICFVYDYDPVPQCWMFHRRAGGLFARFLGDGPGTELTVVSETTDPMLCPGPDVGA